MKMERRSRPRVAMPSDVIVSMDGEEIIGHGLDVSTSGIAFSSPVQKKSGTYLRIRFQIPQMTEWVDLGAVLVRLESKASRFLWAVSFQNPAPRSLLLIKSYVREQVRSRHGSAAIGSGVQKAGSSASSPAKVSPTARSGIAESRHAIKSSPIRALFKQAIEGLSSDNSSKKKKKK